MSTSLCWITDSTTGQAPVVDAGSLAVGLDDGPALTWAELRQAELRCARSLHAAGVRRGDRVGMLLRNHVDYFVLYLAVARIGAIAVRMNWRLTPTELTFIINDADLALLVFDRDHTAQVEAMAQDVSVRTYVVHDGATLGEDPSWATSWTDFLGRQDEREFPTLS